MKLVAFLSSLVPLSLLSNGPFLGVNVDLPALEFVGEAALDALDFEELLLCASEQHQVRNHKQENQQTQSHALVGDHEVDQSSQVSEHQSVYQVGCPQDGSNYCSNIADSELDAT